MTPGLYSEKVMDLFRKPHNMGRMEKPDGIGKVGNPVCGDVMFIYIKVKDNKIADIKFETFGCAAAIATSSMITDLAKGKTLEAAVKITKQDVAGELGGLPPIKMHCSNLASDGLRAAVKNYFDKKGMKPPFEIPKIEEVYSETASSEESELSGKPAKPPKKRPVS
ncbi:MAG: iron-sulfur cluster assembly scaffold protein [archaeon]